MDFPKHPDCSLASTALERCNLAKDYHDKLRAYFNQYENDQNGAGKKVRSVNLDNGRLKVIYDDGSEELIQLPSGGGKSIAKLEPITGCKLKITFTDNSESVISMSGCTDDSNTVDKVEKVGNQLKITYRDGSSTNLALGDTIKNVKDASIVDGKLRLTYTDNTQTDLVLPTGGGGGGTDCNAIKAITIFNGVLTLKDCTDNTSTLDLKIGDFVGKLVKDVEVIDGKLKITYNDDSTVTRDLPAGGGTGDKVVKDSTIVGDKLRITYTDGTTNDLTLPAGGGTNSSCNAIKSITVSDGVLTLTDCADNTSTLDLKIGDFVGKSVKDVVVDEANNKLKITYTDGSTTDRTLPKVVKSTVLATDKIKINYTDGSSEEIEIPCTCKNFITDLSFKDGVLTATFKDGTTKDITINNGVTTNMVTKVEKDGNNLKITYEDGSVITLNDCCGGGAVHEGVKNIVLDNGKLRISYNDTAVPDTLVTLPQVSLVDNITSTDTDKALTANQGKVLNERINTSVKTIEGVAGTSDIKVILQDGSTTTINLDETHFKGVFGTEGDLPTAGIVAGDYADVDTAGGDVQRYVWDNDNSKWISMKGSPATTIINNLTTDETTSALSATQGKVLKDEQLLLLKNAVIKDCGITFTKSNGDTFDIDLMSACNPVVPCPDVIENATPDTKEGSLETDHKANLLVDGDDNTFGAYDSFPVATCFDLGTAKTLTTYELFTKVTNGGVFDDDGNNTLKRWKIKGSNDNSNFTTLDSKDDQDLAKGTVHKFTFTNTTAYRYYMLKVYETKNGNGHAPLNRFSMYEGDECGNGGGGGGTATPVDDNLTSTSTTHALSANQGKTLNDLVTAINTAQTAQDAKINSSVKTIEGVAGTSDIKVTLQDGSSTTINLDETHFKGMFGAEGDLPTAGIVAGDYADVDTAGGDVQRYVWDSNDSKWVSMKSSPATTIINNLTTDETTSALSATQGKVLKGLIDSINTAQGVQDTKINSSIKTIEAISNCKLKITLQDGSTSEVTMADCGGGGTATTVEDILTSTATDKALSSNQGRVLKGLIDNLIIDNLTSTATDKALSAKQGKELDTRVKSNVKQVEAVVGECKLKITKEDGTTAEIDLAECKSAPANQAPTTNDSGTINVDQDTSDNAITLSCSDPDGDTTTTSIVTAPANGTITTVDAGAGTFKYTPNAGYTGNDNFTWKCTDSKGLDSTEKTAILKVNAVVACDDSVYEVAKGDAGHTGNCLGEDSSVKEYDGVDYIYRKDYGCGFISNDGGSMDTGDTKDRYALQWISYANADKHQQVGAYIKTYESVDGGADVKHKVRVLLTSKPLTDPYFDLWADASYPANQRGYWSANATDKANGVFIEDDGHTDGRIIYIYAPEMADGDFHAFKIDPRKAVTDFMAGTTTEIKFRYFRKVYFRTAEDGTWSHVGSVGLFACPNKDGLSVNGQSELKIPTGELYTSVNLGNPPTKT